MSNRSLPVAVLMTIAAVAGCDKAPPPAATAPATAPVAASSAADEVTIAATETALQRTLPAVQFDKVALSDAFAFLSDTSGVKVEPDWAELAKAGLKPSSAISIRLRNVKVSKILKTVLSSAVSTPAQADAVDYEILPSGNIRVTTWDDLLARRSSTERYPIGHLLGDAQAVANMNQPSRDELKDSIRTLIFETIAADRWSNAPDAKAGRPGGTITFDGDTMVVTHIADVQKQVAALLGKLLEQSRRPEQPPAAPQAATQPAR